jgi:hypothetical protein
MPRASWRGFLRLSLVSCPVYLSPATSGGGCRLWAQPYDPDQTRCGFRWFERLTTSPSPTCQS